MAEMPYLPLTPAVIAAVHQATGVWFHEFLNPRASATRTVAFIKFRWDKNPNIF
jgi:hypothetical protein